MVTYPSDWTTYSFDEMFQLYPNNTLSRDKLSEHGGIGNIHYGDVLIKYGAVLSEKDSIPRIRTEFESAARAFLQQNDIIVADTAEDETVGKVVQIGDIPFPLVGGLHTIVCRPQVPTAAGYLGYYMNSKEYHEQLLPYITGIKVSSVSKTSIRKTELHIPSTVEEQVAIVGAIQQFDIHIANLAELIEKKKAVRDGALEDLVSGRTRLAGFTEEWIEVSFPKVVIPKARIGWQGLRSEEYLRKGYSYLIGGTDFSNGTISLRDIWYVAEERYTMDSNIQVSEGDVLVTKDGTIGKVAIVPQMDRPATLNSGVYVFRTKNGLTRGFLYRVLQSSVFRKFIDVLAAGSTIMHLYQKDLKNFSFAMPTDGKEQEAIADVLMAMDNEIKDLEDERDKMIQIREGAMDDLLTGRVRLTV